MAFPFWDQIFLLRTDKLKFAWLVWHGLVRNLLCQLVVVIYAFCINGGAAWFGFIVLYKWLTTAKTAGNSLLQIAASCLSEG